jgi:4-hydroxy-3-methylbut-2-enyl diphosphate reductase
MVTAVVKRLLLASPRGYCAGVERAVETVERALALYGRPVYVRKQIVHNSHVVEDLRARGAVFVDALADVPEGATVVFSAHGIAPAVRREADELRLTTIDATCPLVTKVHAQARRYAEAGYAIVLIGHAGHEEVEGTLGEAPDAIVLVQSTEDAKHVSLPEDRPLAYVTQTTLSVDETNEIVAVLRRRFPHIEGPAREDICYATSNRQWAVKELMREVDLLLVVGSPNSSNSQRLVDVARADGTPAHPRRSGAGAARGRRLRLVHGPRRRGERASAGARGRELQASRRAPARRIRAKSCALRPVAKELRQRESAVSRWLRAESTRG